MLEGLGVLYVSESAMEKEKETFKAETDEACLFNLNVSDYPIHVQLCRCDQLINVKLDCIQMSLNLCPLFEY